MITTQWLVPELTACTFVVTQQPLLTTIQVWQVLALNANFFQLNPLRTEVLLPLIMVMMVLLMLLITVFRLSTFRGAGEEVIASSNRMSLIMLPLTKM